MIKKILLIFLCFCSLVFAEDIYPFKTEKQTNQFNELTQQFRCLVCQNQTIAESNAGLAIDLKEQIYRRILQGQSNKEIIDYLVKRYGDFVLYNPPFDSATWLLWLTPSIVLIISILYLLRYLKRE